MKNLFERLNLVQNELTRLLTQSSFDNEEQRYSCYVKSEPLTMEMQALKQVLRHLVEDFDDLIVALRLTICSRLALNAPQLADCLKLTEEFALAVRSDPSTGWVDLEEKLQEILITLPLDVPPYSRHLNNIRDVAQARIDEKCSMLELSAIAL